MKTNFPENFFVRNKLGHLVNGNNVSAIAINSSAHKSQGPWVKYTQTRVQLHVLPSDRRYIIPDSIYLHIDSGFERLPFLPYFAKQKFGTTLKSRSEMFEMEE